MARHRVLIVEDEQDIAGLIKHTLERGGETEAQIVGSGDAALKAVTERVPDLIILDLNLPVIGGLEVCRILRSRADVPHVPIIMLTARTSEDDRVSGLEQGADDYVTKPFSHRQLAARIRAVLNRAHGGLTPEPAGSLVVGSLRLEMQSHEVTVRDRRTVRLTPLEFRLLYMLAINEGRVVSSSRLVEYAWGYEGGEGSLVKTHISHMRQKLGLDKDRTGAEQPDDVHISTIPWVGYCLRRVREGSASSISAGV
jgi:DNA-binding response OmpR family regulator